MISNLEEIWADSLAKQWTCGKQQPTVDARTFRATQYGLYFVSLRGSYSTAGFYRNEVVLKASVVWLPLEIQFAKFQRVSYSTAVLPSQSAYKISNPR